MEMRTLGRTGVKVSPLCLGTICSASGGAANGLTPATAPADPKRVT